MRLADMSAAWNRVALRKESVDRNNAVQVVVVVMDVALRKESVDRNMPSHWRMSRTGGVALRKESVDRNPAAKAAGLGT